MKRLTNEHGGGFKACNGCIKPHCTECEEFMRQSAVLCDYENTGYTPAEILLSNTSLEILVTLVRENQTFKDLVSKIPFNIINSWAEAYADGRLIVLPKKSNQPLFVKDDAIDIFNYWNKTTGAISNGTSYYYEAHAVIEEIAAMAFGAGMIYQNEAQAALEKMEDKLERQTYWNEEFGCWTYRCPSGDAAKLLAAYENTGLSPEEITKLQGAWISVKDRFLEPPKEDLS